jgi:rubrerythrin
MNIKGSQTEKNLIQSYQGELAGDALYKIFALKAREEGYEDIALSFEKLAKEEVGHSEVFKNFIGEIEIDINIESLKAVCAKTISNLRLASAGEYQAYKETYPEFSRIAELEGFSKIAKVYKSLGSVELRHSNVLKELADKIEN